MQPIRKQWFAIPGASPGAHATRTERTVSASVVAFSADTDIGTTLVDAMRFIARDVWGGVFEGQGR